MEKTGLFKAIKLCKAYPKMNAKEREQLTKDRLEQLITFTRKNSSYYAKKYKNVSEHPELLELPTVNKKDLMEHFDEWVTDPKITMDKVNKFLQNMDHIGRKMDGKYLIFTTSGSTGNPLIAICDKNTNSILSGINVVRSFARSEDLSAFIKKGGKTIGVFATSGFYLSNSSVRARLLSMPWKKKKMAVTSALLPTHEIVEQLNQFQPCMLGGYPSNLELLIPEVEEGRLHISPVIIMTGGEYLSDKLREKLAKTFHCYVQTSYACTEGGTIACECREKHFHINDDWVIVEPVDKNNQPVADGVRSDKILLTNLFNYSQPFIRYEVTDRVIMHHSLCKCGNPSPWLELEGRTDDVVSFTENGQIIKVAPLSIYAIVKEVHELRRFQVIVKGDNQVELRIEAIENCDKQLAYEKAKETLLTFLNSLRIEHVTVTLSKEEPKQDKGSGKFKHIINMSE